ncbi:MAG: VCBS repeat-containing protein [candidate division Zixibacteria bacterium]|nr:VCBS repeat-containing protein [candidate division Zixibacteria bacterium]
MRRPLLLIAIFSLGIRFNLANATTIHVPADQPTIQAGIECSWFAPHQTIPVGYHPTGASAGDLNGDSDIDFAVANEGDGTISIIMNDGSNAFSVATTLAVGTTPTGTAMADFDRDGDLDIAVTNHGSGSITLLTNDGSGNFATTQLAAGANPYSPLWYDLDGDSLPELIFVNRWSGSVGVYENSPSGLLSPFIACSVGNGAIDAAVGDFDRDGWPDVAVANFDASQIAILRNSSGTLSLLATYAAPSNPSSITEADFDGDSILDLAVANNGASNVTILKGTGDCNFTYVDTLTAGLQVGGLAAGDIDKDGDIDLVCADFDMNTRTWTNVGGTLVNPPTTCDYGNTPGHILIDWDKDGDLDLAAALYDANSFTIRTNTLPCSCPCPCLADPQCDSATDVLDVVGTVNVDFRGVPPVSDPRCPRQRTDVDCSSVTDILDVVKMVDVAFRGGDPAVKFCNPCS